MPSSRWNFSATKKVNSCSAFLPSLDKDVFDAHGMWKNSAQSWEPSNKLQSSLSPNCSQSSGNKIHMLGATPNGNAMIETGWVAAGAWEKRLWQSRGRAPQESFSRDAIDEWSLNGEYKRREVAEKLEGVKWNVKEKHPKGENGILIWEPKSAYDWAQRKSEILTQKGLCVHLAAWFFILSAPIESKRNCVI